MAQDKDVEEFARFIRDMLPDGHLSAREWDVIFENAPSRGLSPDEAEHLLIRECVQAGAVIEPLEVKRLQELIAIVAPDKVLDDASRNLLKRRIEERYHDTRLPSPKAYADQLFDKLLVENQIWDEATIRRRIEKRLREAAGESKALTIESWRRLYAELLAELGLTADSGLDLVALFHDCRLGLEIAIAEPEIPPAVTVAPSPPPSPPDPGQVRKIEAPRGAPPRRRSVLSVLPAWAQTGLLIGIVAALVFAVLWLVQNLTGLF